MSKIIRLYSFAVTSWWSEFKHLQPKGAKPQHDAKDLRQMWVEAAPRAAPNEDVGTTLIPPQQLSHGFRLLFKRLWWLMQPLQSMWTFSRYLKLCTGPAYLFDFGFHLRARDGRLSQGWTWRLGNKRKKNIAPVDLIMTWCSVVLTEKGGYKAR